MSKPKLYSDYTQLAEERKFTFIGELPRSVRIPTEWRCNLCGRVRKLPYNVFKYVQPACRCRTDFGFSAEDYHRFAAELGLAWIGNNRDGTPVPRTVHEKTKWRVANSEIITVSRYTLRKRFLQES